MTTRLILPIAVISMTAALALCCDNPYAGDDDTESGDQTNDKKEPPPGCAKPVEDTTPLKEAFEDHFEMGVALSQLVFKEVDPDAVALVERHYSRISAENDLKWEKIQRQRGVFDFANADAFVEFGEKRGMDVYGHVLLWHNQVPDWVFNDENGDPADRDTLLATFEAHVAALADRYGGRISYWDVVNEAFEDTGTMKMTEWRRIIGDDYIVEAFKIADRLLPDSKLVYNDYSMYMQGRRDAVVQLVSELREAGVRIDAVGMQGHYDLKNPDIDALNEALAAYRDAEVEVLFTELDLNVLPSTWDVGAEITDTEEAEEALDPYRECLPVEADEAIAERWGALFAAFVENSDTISGITFWGVGDGQSWLNNWPVQGRINYPLLFDRDFKPKTAYERVLEQAK